jgi:UDP-N-acetylmuramate--alanine ligase
MFSEKVFHLVGIGGIGMSGLARILQANGKVVRGSDSEDSPIITKLREEGFEISIPQKKENLGSDVEVVIHTLAVDEKNEEIVEAKKRGLKILTYPQALGEITKEKKVIAISGAHGKTTTTSLIISACLSANLDVSCLVGTNLKILEDKNARVGESEWFIIEACEYKRAFLNLNPHILVITNIEKEHLDYFHDLEDYKNTFLEFAKKLPSEGVLVASSHEANLDKIIQASPNFFDASKVLDNFEMKLIGEFNRRNAKLAFVVGELLSLEAKVKEGIENFEGGERRMEFKGELQEALIYDDYAHHPTEIQATLQGVRERFPNKRIITIYQQHQLHRASHMLRELGVSFFDSDVVVIPNIYEVRDEKNSKQKISGEDLAKEIQKYNEEVYYTHDFEKTITWIKKNAKKDDLIIVMGAGDVFKITQTLMNHAT